MNPWHDWDDSRDTPTLRDFREWIAEDPQIWWQMGCGHHRELFAQALIALDGKDDYITSLRERIGIMTGQISMARMRR